MLITSRELSERSGATKRQIENWCRIGIITPYMKKIGFPSKFNDDIVPSVTALAKISNALNELRLKTIFDHYEDGYLFIGDGIMLDWNW